MSSLTQRLAEHAHDLNADGHHAYGNLPSGNDVMVLAFVMDGGGSDVSTGIKGSVPFYFECNIESVTLLADASGSCVMDVWNDTYTFFPPNVADSITGANQPTLVSDNKYTDNVLSGWTTGINIGDVLTFYIDSLSGISLLTCALELRKV